MKKMGIDPDMSLSEALEYFPQAFPLFKQLGICCVNEENAGLTIGELCTRCGAEAEAFLEAVNSLI